MSRCYACDCQCESPVFDRPTGRTYCYSCFLPTIEEQLRIAGKDFVTPDFESEPETGNNPAESPDLDESPFND
jgi:hypothetical protein